MMPLLAASREAARRSCSTERERELFADQRRGRAEAEPVGALELLGQREPRGDALVTREEFAQERWAVALAAAVQQDDVAREPAALALAAVEDAADRVVRLRVRKVTSAAHDAIFQEPRASGVDLHFRVVIALEREQVEADEFIVQLARDAPEIGRPADAAMESLEEEPVRACAVVDQRDRAAFQSLDRVKLLIEPDDEFFGGAVIERLEHVRDARAVTKDFYIVIEDRPEPARSEVVAVEMR